MLLHLFVLKFILVNFGFFIFCTMVIVPLNEAKVIFVVDDLDFGVRDVAFEAKVFNRYGTFD